MGVLAIRLAYGQQRDACTRPADKLLKHSRRAFRTPRTGTRKDDTLRCRANTTAAVFRIAAVALRRS